MNVEKIFEGLSPGEKKKNLQALASKQEKQTYSRNLTEEEIQYSEKEYLSISRDLARIKEEKRESAENFKNLIKEREVKLEIILDQTSTRKKSVVGVLYSIPDYNEQTMRLYDENGEMIDSRPLKPDEQQTRAFIQSADGATVVNPDETAPNNNPDNGKHEAISFEEVANTGTIPAEMSIADRYTQRTATLGRKGFYFSGEHNSFISKTGTGIHSDEVYSLEEDKWIERFHEILEKDGVLVTDPANDADWEAFEAKKLQEFADAGIDISSGQIKELPNEEKATKNNSKK